MIYGASGARIPPGATAGIQLSGGQYSLTNEVRRDILRLSGGTITVGAEAANVITCTFSFVDVAGGSIPSSNIIEFSWWLTDSTDPAPVTSTAPNGGVSYAGGDAVQFQVHTAAIHETAMMAGDGTASLAFTETGTDSWRLWVRPGGARIIYVSSALSFT